MSIPTVEDWNAALVTRGFRRLKGGLVEFPFQAHAPEPDWWEWGSNEFEALPMCASTKVVYVFAELIRPSIIELRCFYWLPIGKRFFVYRMSYSALLDGMFDLTHLLDDFAERDKAKADAKIAEAIEFVTTELNQIESAIHCSGSSSSRTALLSRREELRKRLVRLTLSSDRKRA